MSDPCGKKEKKGIFQKLHSFADKNFIPLNATIEVTLKCNFQCRHCYNYDRSKQLPKVNALSDSQMKNLLQELSESGCLYCCFTGGEALLNPMLETYIGWAAQMNMITEVKSNGALISQRVLNKLIGKGLKVIEFSLYGASAESHEAFTRTKGTFDCVIQGIRNASKSGLETKVSIVIHKGNYKEFSRMLEMCQQMGVVAAGDYLITKRNDKSVSSLDTRLNESQIRELLSLPGGERFLNQKNDRKIIRCACARTNVGIGANGDVLPCIGAPIPSGNLHNMSFSEIWTNSRVLNDIRDLKFDDYKECSKCPQIDYCNRSSGAVYLNTGSYTGADPWACENAKILTEMNLN